MPETTTGGGRRTACLADDVSPEELAARPKQPAAPRKESSSKAYQSCLRIPDTWAKLSADTWILCGYFDFSTIFILRVKKNCISGKKMHFVVVQCFSALLYIIEFAIYILDCINIHILLLSVSSESQPNTEHVINPNPN